MAKTKAGRNAGHKKDSKNGKKEGVSGSSFFTWFMVIALLGVWTSVAVVWFDLVDYEEVLGKLGIYDADGDGDFDIDDAKVLLGLMERPAQATAEDESEEEHIHPDDLEDAEEIIQAAHIHAAQHSPPEEENEEDESDDAAPLNEDEVTFDAEYLEEIFNDDNEDLAAEDQLEEEGVQVEEEEIQAETLSAHLHSEPELEQEEDTEDDEEVELTEEGPADGIDAFDTLDETDETDNIAEGESEYNEEEDNEPESVQETESELESPQVEDSEPEHYSEPEQESEPEHESILEPEVESEPKRKSEPVFEQEQEPEPEVEVEIELEPEPELEYQQEEPDSEPETEYQGELEPEHESESESLHHEQGDYTTADASEHEAEVEIIGDADQSHERISDKHPNDQEVRTSQAEPQQAHLTEKKKKPKLLNKFDKSIKTELDAAEKLRKQGKTNEAVKAFEELVRKYPQSPRARYGKAQCEDDMAEKMRSNEILQNAISTYEEVAGLPNAPSDLIKLALKRRANRQQFLGRTRGSLTTLQKLIQLFPDDVSLRNDLGVGYLLLGDNNNAKEVYEEVLSMAPNDGFAKVHYGFILKAQNQIAESIPYLKEGLESGDPGTDDGRFYFHLGDAMQRVGNSEAYKWYEIGHKRGHFASVWQRSLYNVNGLKAQPWWTMRETGYTDLVKSLEKNWKVIRDEGLAVMDKEKGLFIPEDENLREKGDWSQYTLWQQGRKNENACKAAPRTCALLERYPESTGCRRGQIKYSVMHPGTHVWPHTGPTNCRLRMHLGLVTPKEGCRIRCANVTRSWDEGKVLIFDDSFEHEVWQDADHYRMIFIVDVWHPELTAQQRRTLPAI